MPDILHVEVLIRYSVRVSGDLVIRKSMNKSRQTGRKEGV